MTIPQKIAWGCELKLHSQSGYLVFTSLLWKSEPSALD